ncbi:hypothetical protein R3P38DRAFT_3472025 [Favolaschia claudopus]|uniref:Uncharacterized protein n=1 Tax=Favolaschia claudopus TaxID=2862362 RepID=A0AAV9ZBX0_9AGAR
MDPSLRSISPLTTLPPATTTLVDFHIPRATGPLCQASAGRPRLHVLTAADAASLTNPAISRLIKFTRRILDSTAVEGLIPRHCVDSHADEVDRSEPLLQQLCCEYSRGTNSRAFHRLRPLARGTALRVMGAGGRRTALERLVGEWRGWMWSTRGTIGSGSSAMLDLRTSILFYLEQRPSAPLSPTSSSSNVVLMRRFRLPPALNFRPHRYPPHRSRAKVNAHTKLAFQRVAARQCGTEAELCAGAQNRRVRDPERSVPLRVVLVQRRTERSAETSLCGSMSRYLIISAEPYA